MPDFPILVVKILFYVFLKRECMAYACFVTIFGPFVIQMRTSDK